MWSEEGRVEWGLQAFISFDPALQTSRMLVAGLCQRDLLLASKPKA